MTKYTGSKILAKNLALFTFALAFPFPAFATQTTTDVVASPELWQRDKLTGNWGGLRTDVENAGLNLNATEVVEAFDNPTGGVREGSSLEGRLEMDLGVDFGKLAGINGLTGFVNAFQIQGRGLAASDIHNILGISGIEAVPTTRLFDLWLQQTLFNDRLSIRVGQLSAGDEFVASQYSALFVDASFGWPAILASDLPGGGPAFPLTTPGARVRIGQPDQVSFQVAVFNGNPAGPGTEPAQLLNPSGTTFSLNQGALIMMELSYAMKGVESPLGMPGTYKIGGLYHTGNFKDLRRDANGLSQADPASTGVAANHSGDYGIYGVIDQMLWRNPSNENQTAGAFVRAMTNPEGDRNTITWFVNAGVNLKGLIPNRSKDTLGIGFAYANISDSASGLDEDTNLFSRTSAPVRDDEALIEVTYRMPITPWLSLQPDFQYVIHPGGNVANPNIAGGTTPVADAAIVGLRTTINF